MPPPPTSAASRLCDGWGREEENCAADRKNQPRDTYARTSKPRSDSARTRYVQIGHRDVNEDRPSVEKHPYVHWYTQQAFDNLLAETKSRRKCVESNKDLWTAPEIARHHCWDHFVYYLCRWGFLTARQESFHFHQ